ncbi:hypothetical protein EG328_001183 [Venturia inaequalis]|uniref:3-oxoacyl-[acyl-carrier-protein] reductase n=1 Tax=Venturia inaequalis TaxID=5025 RepID=A0A8H3YQE4_VENIN|nr:hypothetical protein EG327_010692 [Venturia inaequalis]KAE9978884.1 hypothetical protein EG328_001183 [Venturia inaequalis]
MELKDQVVLITGSTRGLGLAIAKAFHRQGARVVLNCISQASFTTAASSHDGKTGPWAFSEDKGLVVMADVTDANEVDSLFEKVGKHFGKPITTIVNNLLPGKFEFNGQERKSIEQIEYKDFDVHFRGYVRGTLNTTKAALPGFKAVGFGRIINIGSNLVHNPVVPYLDYTTGKAALLGLTRTLAKDVAQYGVTVNLVSGGLLQVTDASAATPESVFAAVAGSTPLGKCTTPEEVADVVLFFACPWSRGITGQEMVVDGGLVMK